MDFDKDALEERRKRIKKKLLPMRQQEQEDEEKVLEEDDDEEEEKYCGYETGSDEELVLGGIAMIKPYFIPKSERDTVVERKRGGLKERHCWLKRSVRMKKFRIIIILMVCSWRLIMLLMWILMTRRILK